MKLFDRDGKINFVDENNVFLGYDMGQQCCEDAGWFISKRQEEAVIRNGRKYDLSKFNFDTSFFKEFSSGDETAIAVFRITDGTKELFIHLHNTHNGYYSHGFEFTNGTNIQYGSL